MFSSYQSHALPRGRSFDPYRERSEGTLNAEELNFCRANGIPLAYDPVQQGMVALTCLDDIAFVQERGKSPGQSVRKASEIVHQQQRRELRPEVWNTDDPHYKLRPWTSHDVSRYAELLGDSKVWDFLPEEYPGTLNEETAASLIELSNSREDHVVLAIEMDGVAVGQIRLLLEGKGPDSTKGEISYWLGRAYWGRGIASSVVPLFTRECFSRFNELQTILARVHRDNIGSARVIQKAQYLVTGFAEGASDWHIFETNRSSYSDPTVPLDISMTASRAAA